VELTTPVREVDARFLRETLIAVQGIIMEQ
jgi:hypothetical protein